MILRIAALSAVVLFCSSLFAADSGSAETPGHWLREDSFVRLSLSAGEPVEALRLLPAAGAETAAVLVVAPAGVSIRPESELGAARPLEGEPSIRPARLTGSFVLRFGDGTYSRALFESGRASMFSLSAKDRELSLRYVVVPQSPGRQVGFAIAWRLYEKSRLVESGWEILPLRNGQKEQLSLKPSRGRAVASLTLQIDSVPEERRD